MTTMVVNNIIQKLSSLGLTDYEAKAYVALLSTGEPMTAYEMARESQIPSSKIYETVGKLTDNEIIQPIDAGNGRRYVPIPFEEFARKHRARTESSIEAVTRELQESSRRSSGSVIWNLDQYDSFIDKAQKIIEGSKKTVMVSLCKEEMARIHPVLAAAEKQNVKIAVVHFGEVDQTAGMLHKHPIADTLYEERGGRGFTLVADSSVALIGTVYKNGSIEGGWSQSRGFVLIAEDYIKHDVYIMKIVSRFDAELLRRFGERYALLRDIFTDREVPR